MTFAELIELCKAEALAHKLHPTESSDWRWFCREYSRTFHTPLHLVMDMDPEHVVTCVFEDAYDSRKLRNRKHLEFLVEELRRIEDPNYDSTKEQEFDDFGDAVEAWDDEREAAGAPAPGQKGGKVVEPTLEPPKDLPKEGFLDLSYLENSEDEK